jgi:hypothetical protein
VVGRLEALLDGCKFRFLPDVSASRVMDWLADLRGKGGVPTAAGLEPGREWFTRAEVGKLLGIKSASVTPLVRRHRLPAEGKGKARRFPRATVAALLGKKGRGASVETSNQYLAHLKSFFNWLVKDRRIGESPVAHLAPGNIDVDRRHDRRELGAGELRRLLLATPDSERTLPRATPTAGCTTWPVPWRTCPAFCPKIDPSPRRCGRPGPMHQCPLMRRFAQGLYKPVTPEAAG